jgi:hypothetical protein
VGDAGGDDNEMPESVRVKIQRGYAASIAVNEGIGRDRSLSLIVAGSGCGDLPRLEVCRQAC